MTTLEINEEVESLKQISIAICNGIVQKKIESEQEKNGREIQKATPKNWEG
jgi:hypothetical protein